MTDVEVRRFRARLTAAAMDLFATQGYEAFSLRNLAREAGCSHTAPYRYFSSVDEILAAVRVEGFHRFTAALQRSIDQTAPAVERLRQFGVAYLAFARDQPAAFRVVFEMNQTRRQPAQFPALAAAKLAAWDALESTVAEAIADGELRHASAEALAYLFWASVHGVASLELADGMGDGPPAEVIVRQLIEALIVAHRSPSPSNAPASTPTAPIEPKS